MELIDTSCLDGGEFDPFNTPEVAAYEAEVYTEDQLFYVYCWDSLRQIRTFRCFIDSSGLLLNATPRHPVYTSNYKHYTYSRERLTGRHLGARVQKVTAWSKTPREVNAARQLRNARYYAKKKAQRMSELLEGK